MGIEPMNEGFADLRLTTWPRRHLKSGHPRNTQENARQLAMQRWQKHRNSAHKSHVEVEVVFSGLWRVMQVVIHFYVDREPGFFGEEFHAAAH